MVKKKKLLLLMILVCSTKWLDHLLMMSSASDPAYNSCKWYDHADDMLAISNKHPNILFKVHGEGEEVGDIWDKWFLNGKMQVCEAKIVIPDFDPEQLK